MAVEVQPQRITGAITKENVKLRPGQYLISTPRNTEEVVEGRKKVTVERPYSGTAYGIKFTNNVAIIDDETVREIREVMLAELEQDENRLPPHFRDPNGSAEALARKLQSDFGYEVTPPLAKLKPMTRRQVYESGDVDESRVEADELTFARDAEAKPGQRITGPKQSTRGAEGKKRDSKGHFVKEKTPSKREAPVTGRKLPGVDPDAEVRGMPETPPQ